RSPVRTRRSSTSSAGPRRPGRRSRWSSPRGRWSGCSRRPTCAGAASIRSASERPLRLAAGVPLGEDPPLVVVALAPGQPDLDLGPAVLEVDAQRDEREALLLGAPVELVDLLVVQQQLAPADGVELTPAERVRRDVHPVQPDLALLDPRVRVLEI